MDINDIFKESVTNTSLTASKNKRKLGATPSLRQLKDLGYGTEAPNNETNDTLNSKRIRTEPDHPDTQEPNSNDEDDDEGGRFFADGLTTQQKDVLEWVDNADDIEETLDHQGVQKLVSKLEHAMSKNTQQRIKHADKPQEFAESEADLDEAIRNFLPLTNNPKYLHVLEDLGAIPSLVELLGHENEDIVMDVIELVSELTSMDAWEQDGESSEEKQWVMEFVSALQKSEFFSALGYSLRRLSKNTRDGDSESTYEGDDASGVAKTLDIVENLVGLDPSMAEKAAISMDLLDWLQTRIDTQDTTDTTSQQYAAELTSIILQACPNMSQLVNESMMESLLRSLAKYRNHSPRDTAETEYLENIVNSICVLVTTNKGKQVFESLDGSELMAVLQKQPELCRLLALKVLDFALSPAQQDSLDIPVDQNHLEIRRKIARRYIESMGLKHLFSVLMRRGKSGMQKIYKKHPESDERAMSCISWLFRLTDQDSPLHWRVLAKFISSPVDDHSWKSHVDRLVELNIQYAENQRSAEELLRARDDEDVEEGYLDRQESGLFALQTTDIVIAFVSTDQGARERIVQRLRRKGRSLKDVGTELTEYIAAKQASTLEAIDLRGKSADTGSSSAALDSDADLTDMLAHL